MKTRSFFVPETSVRFPYVSLSGKDLHHLKKVLRLKKGDKISIVTMKNRYTGCIQELHEKTALIFLSSRVESPLEDYKVHLIQGIPKGRKMDFIIEKGTEIGISSFHPAIFQRTVPVFSKDKGEERVCRWQRIAQAATKQSGSQTVPAVFPIQTLTNVLNGIELSPETLLLVAYESEEQQDLCQILRKTDKNTIRDCWIVIGPEGGIAPSEMEDLMKNNFKSVTLGHQILRTETAGFFMAGLIRYLVEYQT